MNNASCSAVSSYEQMLLLDHNPYTTIITSKTCTLNPKIGPKRYQDHLDYTLNNIGLDNPGFVYYNNLTFEKPYVISIAGSNEEIIYMIKNLSTTVYGVEINTSCPNTSGQIIGYNLYLLKNLIDIIPSHRSFKVGLKLPPYLDKTLLAQVATIIASMDYIVCCNTIPSIYGGIGGSSTLKLIALSNCQQFIDLLSIDVIGCGGIQGFDDVKEFLKIGCKSVQVASLLIRQGLDCFKN